MDFIGTPPNQHLWFPIKDFQFSFAISNPVDHRSTECFQYGGLIWFAVLMVMDVFNGSHNGLKLTLAKICQAFIREMYVAIYGNCLVKFGWNISSWGRRQLPHCGALLSSALPSHFSALLWSAQLCSAFTFLCQPAVQHSVCHIAVPHCKPTNQLGFPTLLQVTTKEDKWGPWCIKRVFSFSVK